MRAAESDPAARQELESLILNEKKLRERVGAAVTSSCPCAPQWLLPRVRETLAGVDGPIKLSRRRSLARFVFAEPHRMNVLAVAATLALVAGAVLFGIFGNPIDRVAPASAADLISDAVQFAEKEHGECAGSVREAMDKIDQTDPNKAQFALENWLGAPIDVFDLTSVGYQFVGAGQCGMPVPARSGHLIYRKQVEAGQRAPLLSVFMVRNQGQCRGKLCQGLDKGKWGCVSECGVKCSHKVMRGTDGTIVYFLVCCDDRDLEPVSHLMRLAAGASTAP